MNGFAGRLSDGYSKLALFPRLAASLYRGVPYTPLYYLYVDVTTRCNFSCPMCEWPRFEDRGTDCSLEDFKRTIDSALRLGLKKVVVGSHGEPTLHPDIAPMLHYLVDKGLRCDIVTNLNCRRPATLEALAKLSMVTVSIDGARAATYEKSRPGGNFTLLRGNLAALAARKGRITLNFTIHRHNWEEIAELIPVASELGVKKIHYLRLNNLDKDVLAQVDLGAGQVPLVIEQLEQAGRAAAAAGIETNSSSLITQYRKAVASRRPTPPCYMMWLGAFVTAGGEVFPCCDARKLPSLEIGRLSQAPLDRIWFSECFGELRKAFFGELKPALCDYCCYEERHRQIHRAVSLLPFLPQARAQGKLSSASPK